MAPNMHDKCFCVHFETTTITYYGFDMLENSVISAKDYPSVQPQAKKLTLIIKVEFKIP